MAEPQLRQVTSPQSKQPQSSKAASGNTSAKSRKNVLQQSNNNRAGQQNQKMATADKRQAAAQAATASASQDCMLAPLVPPSQQVAKQNSVLLQSTLRGLKDNYVSIEQQIESETLKQRNEQQERYAQALEKIHQLKKILKTEVEQRKHAEQHFRDLIQEKSQTCLSQFTVSYLNKLHAMHETVQTFEKRKNTLEEKRKQLRFKIETSMRDSRESIVHSVQMKQQVFEQEYQKQVDLDIRELKQIGELKHNYEQMTQQIGTNRSREFTQLKQLLVNTIRDTDIYEREESVRRILTKQINTLKDQLKLEMQNRQMADREIQEALNKYQLIIQEQVERQRREIKASKNQAKPAAAAPQSPTKR